MALYLQKTDHLCCHVGFCANDRLEVQTWPTISLLAEDRSSWFALTPFRTTLVSAADGIKDRVESTALKVPFGPRMAVLVLYEDVVGESVFQNDGLAHVSGGGS